SAEVRSFGLGETIEVVRQVECLILDLVNIGCVLEEAADGLGRMGMEILIAGGEGSGGEGRLEMEIEEDFDEVEERLGRSWGLEVVVGKCAMGKCGVGKVAMGKGDVGEVDVSKGKVAVGKAGVGFDIKGEDAKGNAEHGET
ncbi:hypothetical protein U1Q18_007783, partial [Sarracenia purpurea var. burkii]